MSTARVALLLDEQEFTFLHRLLQWFDSAPGPQIIEVGKLREVLQDARPPAAGLTEASTDALLAEVARRMNAREPETEPSPASKTSPSSIEASPSLPPTLPHTPPENDAPIDQLNLAVRSYNVLKREAVHTIGDLAALTEVDLLEFRGFNDVSLADVKAKLHAVGLALVTPSPLTPAPPPVQADPPEELTNEQRLLSVHRDCSTELCMVDHPAECPFYDPAYVEAASAAKYRHEVADIHTEHEWSELSPEELAKKSATLRDLLAHGLPTGVSITSTPDVLALYGVDMDEVEATIRQPSRVEVRPESIDKKYAVLAFFRGDMQVILGFRFPRTPGVMAVYLGSMLTNDTHRVEHVGGGGARRHNSLPTTAKQLIARLKATGAIVTHDPQSSSGAMLVEFRGQELGHIAAERTPRAQVQSDYNRMLRRMQAIARREEGLAS